ncbi:MAG TPA: EamA family transporter [Gammaproteobacteria bacterium]|nr:EamA family transporter [Gammaproteobacteria bacterium]
MITSINWFPAALLSLLCFGLWGFFAKMAVTYIDAKSALFYQALGITFIGLVILVMLKFKPAAEFKGINFAFLSGIVNGLGLLLYLVAADRGKITSVVTLTGLYPLITIFLAFAIIHESISARQGVGIVMALAAIYLLS